MLDHCNACCRTHEGIYGVVPLKRGQYSTESSQNTPHSWPVRARFRCNLLFDTLIYSLLQSVQCCIKYRVILDCFITAHGCIYLKPLRIIFLIHMTDFVNIIDFGIMLLSLYAFGTSTGTKMTRSGLHIF